MVGWHCWLSGHGFRWTLGVGDGQGGLACCASWGCKELDTTERLNWIEIDFSLGFSYSPPVNKNSFTQLVLTFLFKGVVLGKTVDSVCPREEGRSGAPMSWVNRNLLVFCTASSLLVSLIAIFFFLPCVSVCPSFSHSLVLVLFKTFKKKNLFILK